MVRAFAGSCTTPASSRQYASLGVFIAPPSLGARTRRGLYKIAHAELAVVMLPIRNRACGIGSPVLARPGSSLRRSDMSEVKGQPDSRRAWLGAFPGSTPSRIAWRRPETAGRRPSAQSPDDQATR
jgi:hypothetical protein